MDTPAARQSEPTMPAFIKGVEFKKAKLECMRNMATMTAYTFGASYLIHQRPRIFGSQLPSVLLGWLLFLVAVWGTISASELFLDAATKHYSGLRSGIRDTFWARLAFVSVAMIAFCIMAAVPYVVFYGMPQK